MKKTSSTLPCSTSLAQRSDAASKAMKAATGTASSERDGRQRAAPAGPSNHARPSSARAAAASTP